MEQVQFGCYNVHRHSETHRCVSHEKGAAVLRVLRVVRVLQQRVRHRDHRVVLGVRRQVAARMCNDLEAKHGHVLLCLVERRRRRRRRNASRWARRWWLCFARRTPRVHASSAWRSNAVFPQRHAAKRTARCGPRPPVPVRKGREMRKRRAFETTRAARVRVRLRRHVRRPRVVRRSIRHSGEVKRVPRGRHLARRGRCIAVHP